MRAYDLIQKKRDGGTLTRQEIEWWVEGVARRTIPDEQVAAWAMAVFFRGMDARETADLTRAMAFSGGTVDLSDVPGIKVDKHSTGGVGDTTTLVLAPLVAAAGIPVAKLSGRGLGHTGGTLDKLESFPGFRVELGREAFTRQVREIGIAVAGQTADLVPADKRLYALRDVTATVDSIPLIAASIMSKKIAGGADAIVLDVKVGSGALMKTLDRALELARLMVDIGRQLDRRVVAVVTDMNQPLGRAVGNALEVREAILTLKGQGPAQLTELCLTLGGYMAWLGGKAPDPQAGRALVARHLQAGDGLAVLRRLVAAQGGDPRAVDDPDLLPQARYREVFTAPRPGYLVAMDARAVGTAAMVLGAGRTRKDDVIDLAAGLVMRKRLGERVEAGEPLVELHFNDPARLEAAREWLERAFTLAEEPAPVPPLIHAVVGADPRPAAAGHGPAAGAAAGGGGAGGAAARPHGEAGGSPAAAAASGALSGVPQAAAVGVGRKAGTGWETLHRLARAARESAVAPFSRYRVGAALETAGGRIYTGGNIENASFGLTMCAERVALFKALSEGERRFTRIVITADGPEPAFPCGACRQLLFEYAPGLEVWIDGQPAPQPIEALLPLGFRLER
ncbi:pyrimidine-nucleoside phosphorylase [Thermaerobacter marianensis DSM 12885]|uniref:Pyrimidine-nucleoside phosphorylase n=1 Tax=Thermaerobacter marianensis (strain ATCC 700841 / DSM 12885 / JCM 10246 / 7p75a) TaxID=644966 RepID=E6SLB5_THEM7|nr:pyrimidine-nucleoside phosphorylase [Thermaerobacter marianensis]ADU51346.1 pyrimidine-nucleoside phosphorylase [Thermaerobacter marianensis DSM 12885]